MTKQMLYGGVLGLALLTGLSGCTDPYDPAQRTVGGGLLGAATGAAIGAAVGGGHGAALGGDRRRYGSGCGRGNDPAATAAARLLPAARRLLRRISATAAAVLRL